MQPQDEKQQEWQQPQAAAPHAPYQPPVQDAPTLPIANEGAPIELAPEVTNATTANEETLNTSNEDDQTLIRWQATEYVHQERTALWFVLLGVVVVILMVLAVLVMKSITFAILLPVMAATLVIYVKRPPSPNDYILSRKGLHINDRLYEYSLFKSFGIIQHNGHNSIVLIPRKRFQLGQTIYFPEEVGEPLVDMLAARLPMNEAQPDFIDKLLAKLHL